MQHGAEKKLFGSEICMSVHDTETFSVVKCHKCLHVANIQENNPSAPSADVF